MAAAPTLLDRFIGQFSPGAALRRMRERDLLARAYEAASPRDGWKPRRAGASANADHMADAATIRAKARNLVQNVPYIAAGMEKHVANVIGTGIVPRSLAPTADAIDALWTEWGKVADADGERDIYGLMATADFAMEQDGEVLVRLRNRRPEDGLPVPLQLQVLEIDWLDSAKNGTTDASGTIIGGIEYDMLGRKAAYWLFPHHPGDPQSMLRGNLRGASKPVPASAVIHLFNPKRPGQGRGFSRLAPVINTARDLRLYEDAELHRKNLETRLSVIASGDAARIGNEMSPEEAQKTGSLGELPSGGILQAPAGFDLTVVEPKAAPGYVDYVKHQLHLIAAGMGITYEMLSGDMREVNFSSARVALLEYRRSVEHFQWLTFIPKLCEPIWRAFIDAAYLAGKVRTPDYRVDWSTPKWDYVNPEQDVKADMAEISGGLSSFSEKLRRRGYKPQLVFDELKSDMQRLQADGTLELLLALQGRGMPGAAQGTQPEPDAGDAKRTAPSAQSTLAETMRTVLDQQRTLIERAAAPAPAPTMHFHPAPISVTNEVAPTPVEIRTEVAAPAVTVTNHVSPTPVEVRAEVAAPVVQVTNEITAQAGETKVVMQHPTSAVAVHERDAETQEILRTVTTFENKQG